MLIYNTLNNIYILTYLDILSAITGFETENKYKIFNSVGQQAYYAREGKL